MKWLAAILLVLNVGVYLWASGQQVTVEEINTASKPDVNKEGMLLLRETQGYNQVGFISNINETEQQVKQGQDGSDGINISSLDDELILQEELTDDAQDQTTNPPIGSSDEPAQACYRVGPFKKENSWTAALDWIKERNVPYSPVTSESRELRAVRVFMGPYNSETQIAPVMKALKEKKLDHFVYQVEEGVFRVSLGYFTQEELASKFLGYLESIKVQANAQPEYRQLGPYNWLEIPFEAVQLEALSQRNWLESSIGLSRVEC